MRNGTMGKYNNNDSQTRKTNRAVEIGTEYLRVHLWVQVQGLDLAGKRRSRWRWEQRGIIESSTVWENVQSIMEMECVQSRGADIFHWRSWWVEVSPNRNPYETLQSIRSVKYSVMVMNNPRSIVNDQGADPLSGFCTLVTYTIIHGLCTLCTI